MCAGEYYNFDKVTINYDYQGVDYDYDSIMHYGPFSFSVNYKRTMLPTKLGVIIREPYDKTSLTRSDVTEIRKAYKCNGNKGNKLQKLNRMMTFY